MAPPGVRERNDSVQRRRGFHEDLLADNADGRRVDAQSDVHLLRSVEREEQSLQGYVLVRVLDGCLELLPEALNVP